MDRQVLQVKLVPEALPTALQAQRVIPALAYRVTRVSLAPLD